MCNNTQKKKAAGAGKDFTLYFGVMLRFNFKCARRIGVSLLSEIRRIRTKEGRSVINRSKIQDKLRQERISSLSLGCGKTSKLTYRAIF